MWLNFLPGLPQEISVTGVSNWACPASFIAPLGFWTLTEKAIPFLPWGLAKALVACLALGVLT